MTKDEFTSLAGKGPVPMSGTTITVTIRPEKSESQIISYTAARLNNYTTDAKFGDVWLEHVPDDQWEQIPAGVATAVEKMQYMEQAAQRTPYVLTTEDREYVRRDNKKLYGIDRYKDEHFSIFTLCGGEFDCPICAPVILDGIRYAPVHSFWLDRTVFLIQTPDGYSA